MYLICGLGNPGPEYIINRHNVGFLFIDYLAKINNLDSFKNKYDGLYGQIEYQRQPAILLKPQTFMNLSGTSVVKLATFYKIPPENIIIIHDELDIKYGEVKTKLGGGHAGHNGLKDIDNKIGNGYHRIRIGIDHPRNTDTPQITPANYVLQNFKLDEQEKLIGIFEDAEQKLKDII